MTSEPPISGVLYVVATPIGNLEDITLRALRILGEVDFIAAEDTRHTRKLLSHFNIQTPLIAYHQHSDPARLENLILRLQSGGSVALVTDAGTPGVSDPGADLVQSAIAANVPVVPLPGASAVLCALAASGLPPARFAFEGFLPRTKSAMKNKLHSLHSEPRTLIFYEAPSRTADTLAALADVFGPQRRAVVARELTKKYEEFVRGSLAELSARFAADPPRGEITILIAPAEESASLPENPTTPLTLEEELASALASGLSERDAVRHITQKLQMGRREVYAAMLEMKSESGE